MKTQFKFAWVLALLAACSGEGVEGTDHAADILPYADEAKAIEDGLPPLAYFYADLGQVEQAFGAKNTPTYQYGTRTGSSRARCDRASTGQVCSVPGGTGVTGTVAAKSATWRFTPGNGLSAADQTQVTNAMAALDNTLGNWSLPFTTASSGVLQFANAAVSGASSSPNIDSFVDNSFNVVGQLTEAAGVVGAYQTHTGCVISLDVADIDARGAVEEAKAAGNQGERGKLMTHAILSGAMKCLGLGMRDDAASANMYIDRQVLFPGPLFRPLMTTGDQCQANSYDPFSTIGQYDLITPACAND